MSDPSMPEGGRLISAVAAVARALTQAPSWIDAAPEVLRLIGEATDAGYVCAYENVLDDEGRLWMVRRADHSASDSRRLGDLWGDRRAYDDGYARWIDELGAGSVIRGAIESFPDEERERLAADGIASLVAVPVPQRDRWWGSLVLTHDDDRSWTVGEEDALIAVAEMVGAAVDRTEHDRLLRDAERRHRAHIEAIPAITYIENVDGAEPGGYGEVYVSPQIETMLGYSQETWLAEGGHWQRAIHPEDYQRVADEGERTNATGEPFIEEYRVRTAWGQWRWIHDESRLVRDEDGTPLFWHGLLTDITARKEAEAQVAFLAYHDPLTGLANRALFEEMLESALARARRGGTAVAVLFGDLDGFKEVNDTLGHHAGDDLLRGIADRLEPITRDTDVVARQGGDEFLVLMSDLPVVDGERFGAATTAAMMTDRIRAALIEPFEIGGGQVRTSISIGSSIYPLDGNDLRSLLAHADRAMYEGKRSRGRIDLGSAARDVG